MPGQLKREDVRCGDCGEWFSRSIAHPYISLCERCRKGKPLVTASKEERELKRRVKCPACRELVQSDGRLGLHYCAHRCGTMWWAIPGGWWRNWDTDEVFKLGTYVGSLRESRLREVVRA